jgi:hypothetical protein
MDTTGVSRASSLEQMGMCVLGTGSVCAACGLMVAFVSSTVVGFVSIANYAWKIFKGENEEMTMLNQFQQMSLALEESKRAIQKQEQVIGSLSNRIEDLAHHKMMFHCLNALQAVGQISRLENLPKDGCVKLADECINGWRECVSSLEKCEGNQSSWNLGR